MTYIDLCCGIGGFRQVLAEMNHQCLLSCDINKECQIQNQKRYGELPIGDIFSIDSNKLTHFDVLVAGFPCQPFSISGLKKGFEDKRGNVFTWTKNTQNLELSRVHRQPNRIYHDKGVHPTISSQESAGRYYIYDSTLKCVRKLTIKEIYHLMGFPYTFNIHPTKTIALKQIGNSVVVPMIREILISIFSQYNNNH